MSALAITLLRFGFLALLWIFVFSVVFTVRRDTFGVRVHGRKKPSNRKKSAKSSARTARSAAGGTQPRALFVTQGPLAGTQLALSSGVVISIGRSPDSALVLDDGYASSRHARIFLDGGRAIIEDLNSTNGTWVGGVRIHEPTVIPLGVPVTIGKTELKVQ